MSAGPQVVILGLDGATLTVIEPWVKANLLPNLGRVMGSGSYGTLTSTHPATTPLAWPSIYTGRDPGGHGLFGFQKKRPGSYEWQKASAADVRAPTLWDAAGQAGIRSGIFFVPYTFPARPFEGMLVAGRGAPRKLESRLSYPENLAGKMAAEFGERALFGPRRSVDQVLKDVAERLINSIHQQTEAVAWAVKQDTFDLLFTVWDHSDTAAHLFWHYSQLPYPDETSTMFRVYRAIDDGIGRVLEVAGGDPLVVVCSDHGTHPVRTGVRAHLWLAEKGYLTLRAREPARRKSGIRKALRSIPKPVRALVPLQTRRRVNRSLQPTAEEITEWGSTDVYPQPISAEAMYLNLQGREPNGTVPSDRVEETVARLTEDLMAMTGPDGERLVKAVHKNEEVYSGPHSAEGPDLIVEMFDGAMLAPARLGQKDVFWTPAEPNLETDPPRSVCYHALDGIVCLSGPRVRTGVRLAGQITDIAPTVLRYLDVDLPKGVDGAGLQEAFEDLAEPRWSDIESSEHQGSGLTADEEEDIDKHLRELGYIE